MEDELFQRLFGVVSEDNAEELWIDLLKHSETDVKEIRDDVAGWTVLHYASENLLPRVVEWLLKNGADPNAQDDDARTPFLISLDAAIDYAVQRDLEKIDFSTVSLLLKYGADKNHVSDDGLSMDRILELYGERSRNEFDKYFQG